MRLYKRIFSIGMVLLFLMIDTSVLPFSNVDMQYFPKFGMLSVITIALLLGRTQGILYGAICGALMDITVTIPTGLIAALYTISGFLSGYIGRKSRYRLLSSIIAPVISILIYEAVFFVYYFSATGALPSGMLLAALIRCAFGTAVVQILYILFNLVLKPKHSRYARR